MDRTVWLSLPSSGEFVRLFTAALEAGFTRFLLTPEQHRRLKGRGRFEPLLLDGDTIRDSGGGAVGRFVRLRTKADEGKAVRAARGGTPFVLVRTGDWKVIPWENLIAGFRGTGAVLVAEVSTAEEASLALHALEAGAGGVCMRLSSAADARALLKVLAGMEAQRAVLTTAKVVSVRHIGPGDRVCVDTTSLLGHGEGLLVGSQSHTLFLVHSESLATEYAAPRPFRVNAGAVHSYILAPGMKTRYLSELVAGDELLAVRDTGECRTVAVGRAKTERRPLLLVTAEAAGRKASVVLQNAETINLVSGGKPLSVVTLKPGDEVVVWTSRDSTGRHFGTEIDEKVLER